MKTGQFVKIDSSSRIGINGKIGQILRPTFVEFSWWVWFEELAISVICNEEEFDSSSDDEDLLMKNIGS